MPIDNNASEPTEDDIYLAKMTMDEVGADIEQHGHVAVTNENRTQDPFTTKGSLANALDEALDYSNPNYDPTNESQGDVEGITNDPQSPKKSDEEIKPDDTTMDKAPEILESAAAKEDAKTVKDSLSEALDSVFAMDAVTEVPEEADDEAHHKWQRQEIEKNVPEIPESMGGGDKPDSNGLIYLDYTFTVDPEKYNSPNYQPIADAGSAGVDAARVAKDPNEQAANDKVDEEVSVEETIVEAGGEPSKDAEKVAAKVANENEKEVASIGKLIEKKAEDEAVEKVVLDYATFIDGSSFMCFDDDTGVDYTKIAMDAGLKKPVTRQTCKTTFAQCRAKNPLFCRFHGPKLLEKDIKSAISAALGKGCVVSVTKDKGQKNPLTFRLTIGCPPAMKKDVEKIVHMFMTQNPGISSPEEYKDLGNGKQTTEFDMDILKADEPPKKNDLKGQAAQWETEQAKAKGKTMPIVGETPPKVEKLANEGGVQQTEEQPPKEEVEEKVKEKVEPTQTEEEKNKFELEEEFNNALLDYPDNSSGDDDVKNLEIHEAFQKAYTANDAEGMKSAIEAMKKLASDVKGKEGEKTGEGEVKKEDLSSANAPSGFHFVDDAAMKMTGEIDDLAHQNPELMSGDDNVSALYYEAQHSINEVDEFKQAIEILDKKIKNLSNESPTAANAIALKALESAKKENQDGYDQAKAHAELSVKDFKEAVEKAKETVVDSIKGTNAEMVENIVKTTARAIFPHGKPDGVDSVVDMIDALHEDMTSLANEKLGAGGDLHAKFLESKKKNGIHEAYKAVSSASIEFDGAVSSFKDLIDGVKSKDGAESLKGAVNGISEYSQKLKDAFAAYKMAVEKVKKDVLDLAEIKEKEKKLSQDGGKDQPSQDEILNAAKKHSIAMASSDVDSSTKYYANEISKVISGEGYPKNVDKKLPNIGSRRDLAKHYLYMLKDLDGVSPLVIAALQKVVDMPKWGEKKKSGAAKEMDAVKADPKVAIKAKIDAMSNKDIMEKSIPILEKKIKVEPNNEKWQKMLKIAKEYLAAHSSKDDDYLE